PSAFSSLLSHDPAPPATYTLSLHDALPISPPSSTTADTTPLARSPTSSSPPPRCAADTTSWPSTAPDRAPRCAHRNWSCAPTGKDRKSTRLNSSHRTISYAVFCLKKKKKKD